MPHPARQRAPAVRHRVAEALHGAQQRLDKVEDVRGAVRCNDGPHAVGDLEYCEGRGGKGACDVTARAPKLACIRWPEAPSGANDAPLGRRAGVGRGQRCMRKVRSARAECVRARAGRADASCLEGQCVVGVWRNGEQARGGEARASRVWRVRWITPNTKRKARSREASWGTAPEA